MSGPGEPDRCLTWARVSDGLVAGLHHALNNRLGAVGAVVQLLRGELPEEHPLQALLPAEMERLEQTVGLLALLRPLPGGDPEPLELARVCRDAERLYLLHHDLRDVPLEVAVPERLPPVRAEPVGVLRVLLTLLAVAASRAANGGRGVRLTVSATDLQVETRVETEPTEQPGFASGGETAALAEVVPSAAESLARVVGGELRIEEREGEVALTLRLPTLAAARRAEGRG